MRGLCLYAPALVILAWAGLAALGAADGAAAAAVALVAVAASIIAHYRARLGARDRRA